ncbi:MAG TPA: helix-turn-helix domain-containing protein [Candidatus Wunengus sp. YC61]|uniref:helix-turn-helix domain-containing protein n=1 Tax=Candidatus Wunengus sp. YC61 TaxID=3367698 RepID=UPI004026A806
MKLNSIKLETERGRMKLSKTGFARHIGMSVSAYCRMLDGASTKITTINRIAEALNYEPKDLLTN